MVEIISQLQLMGVRPRLSRWYQRHGNPHQGSATLCINNVYLYHGAFYVVTDERYFSDITWHAWLAQHEEDWQYEANRMLRFMQGEATCLELETFW